MSLDVYLYAARPTEVWTHNITHNLGRMANAVVFEHSGLQVLLPPENLSAGALAFEKRTNGAKGPPTLYHVLWRPEELGIKRAVEMRGLLVEGYRLLCAKREELETLNPENGWGSYDTLVSFVRAYIAACEQNPDAEISVSR